MTETIRRVVTAEAFAGESNPHGGEVVTTWYAESDGRAHASITFSPCLTSHQLDLIAESDQWEVSGIYPAGDQIEVTVREIPWEGDG